MRHKSMRTCCYLLWRRSRFMQQLQWEWLSIFQEGFFFLLTLCLSQPAPPRSLTSTAPHRLWEDISPLQRSWPSGNFALLLCVLFVLATTVSTRPPPHPSYSSTRHRNGSVIADYTLTFVMPEEDQELLKNFTLSRDMVFNVFRQFLYDQSLQETEPTYIERSSLTMFLSR